MINFPDNPTVGQVHKAGGVLYTFNGQGWTSTADDAPDSNFLVMVSDVPPSVTEPGYLWWENDTGILWILYGDTDTVQWVQATAMMSTENVGAMDFPENPVIDQEYLGYKFNGTGWVIKNTGGPDIYVELAGDQMYGDLHIGKANPAVHLGKLAVGEAAFIRGLLTDVPAWDVVLGDETADSDFAIRRYDAAGVLAGTPLSIDRTAGVLKFDNNVKLESYLPVLTLDASGSDNGRISFASAGVESWRFAFTGNVMTIAGRDIGGAPRDLISFDRTLFSVTVNGSINTTLVGAGSLEIFRVGATIVGSISTDGATTVYNTTSDGRLKTDLKPFDAGVILDKLQVYDFAWKDSDERCHGVVAQEAIEVYPWAVTHTAADWWGVDYSKFVPLLLQEVKALRERVRQLENVRT